MKVLIADDDGVARIALEAMLRKRGFDVAAVADGAAAWDALQAPDPPRLVILDWQMPGRDGLEVCRLVRADGRLKGSYVILLTSRGDKADVIQGLRAGVNDYVTKPFDPAELEARLNVGAQVVRLRDELAQRVVELEGALAQVKRLQGLLPICSYCKRIRDDGDYWHRVESYIGDRSEARFSHSICPDCLDTVVKQEFEAAGLPPPGPLRPPAQVTSGEW
jgi:CheY-like chemotaxis protein